MFIEDEELRNLYKATSAEHIQTIEDGLLHLEKHPQDSDRLEALLRSTHSLKGDSRMLGVNDVETITHQIEEMLQEVQQGKRVLDSALCDRLYGGLDAIRKISHGAITGEPSNVQVFFVLAQLMADEETATEGAADTADSTTDPSLGDLFESGFGSGFNTGLESDFGAALDGGTGFVDADFAGVDFAGAGLEDINSDRSSIGEGALGEPATAASGAASSMYIDDDELRDLYKATSADHIQTIEDGLLHLEKHPQDSDRLEALLRSTHSLKGDSRMLGVNDVETITHQIEEMLQEVQQEKRVLDSALCDRLYGGLDAIRKISHEAITGEPSNVQVFFVLAQLMADADAGAAVSEEAAVPAVAAAPSANLAQQERQLEPFEPTPVAQAANVSTVPAKPASSSNDYRIDTIRVPASKLDTLVAQVSELSVTKTRFAGRLGELDTLSLLWEEWRQEAVVGRSALDDLERQLPANELLSIRKYYHQAEEYLEKLGSLATQLRQSAYEDTARLEIFANQIETGIQSLRLLPLSSVFGLFPRMVRDIAKQQGKQIDFIVEGGDTLADKQILEEIKDPLLHLVRNAIDHGLETPQERSQQGKPELGTIRLRGFQKADSIGIELIDDGRGLNVDRIRSKALEKGLHTEAELQTMSEGEIQALIFSAGFSTRDSVSDLSGRGVGLDVVRSNIERLKGSIHVDSTPGHGCHFRISVNPSLAKTFALLVAIDGTTFALPAESVYSMMMLSPLELFGIEGKQTTTFEGHPLSIAWLSDLLELPLSPAAAQHSSSAAQSLHCVVVQARGERLGVLVDELIDRQDIVLKPQSKLLKRVRNVSGATILGNGEVCIVLNPSDLIASARGSSRRTTGTSMASEPSAPVQKSLLLVEDSIIIRTQMKRLLENAGYAITTAVDGADGFNKLRSGNYDAVVSDVEMPNLDGLGLTAQIRQYEEYDELPIVLLTTLASEDDRRRGAEAGASAYLTKGDFEQSLLFETLERLI
ncbi:MAG: hybrid sensor histidine kinase/response regulator [Cyanobacteria bacterium P01_E01_bin.45]